jgi:hypothetical protein
MLPASATNYREVDLGSMTIVKHGVRIRDVELLKEIEMEQRETLITKITSAKLKVDHTYFHFAQSGLDEEGAIGFSNLLELKNDIEELLDWVIRNG